MNNTVAAQSQLTPFNGGGTMFDDILTDANRQWRRIGVRKTDRREMLTELKDELCAADADGYSPTAVLGEDRPEMLSQWAHERGLSGQALRLHLVIPAALAGIAVGLALVVSAVFLMFAGRTAFDPGELVLPLYAMSAVLAYLCALTFTRGALAAAGDPHAGATVKWLAILLPLGAALTTGAAVALAWWRNFNPTTKVFTAVIVIVLVGLGLTIALARYAAVRKAHDRHQNDAENPEPAEQ